MYSDTQISAKSDKPVRHILALSGGKDSSALAVYMLGKIPDVEYVFCDTEKELDETYEYLVKLETFLGKRFIFLNTHRDMGSTRSFKSRKVSSHLQSLAGVQSI